MSDDPTLRDTSTRLILEHARPPVVAMLHSLGFHEQAVSLENAPSLSALRPIATDIVAHLRREIRFGPLRRAATSAVSALHSAALLGLRSDPENASVMVLGAFTNAAHALAWHHRWWQIPRWKTVRARILAQARAEQNAYLVKIHKL